MVGPDGGKRALQSSREVVGDVRRAYQLIDAKCSSQLFDKQILKDRYINYLDREEYSADSIKKYLYSLIDYATFILTESIPVPNNDQSSIMNMRLLFQKWKSAYNKPARENFWVRQEEDYSMLVTPAQVRTYRESDMAIEAQNLYKYFESEAKEVSQAEFVRMRDYLIACIHFSNGHRSGVTANLTLTEFRRSEKSSDMYLIKVRKHKNFAYCGPAIISLSPENFNIMKVYIEKVRSQVSTDIDNVIISWTGGPMKSGDISKRLHNLWLKAGIFNDRDIPKNLSANIIRKSTSTGVRASNAGGYQSVADLMAHSLSTAEKHYYMRNRVNHWGK